MTKTKTKKALNIGNKIAITIIVIPLFGLVVSDQVANAKLDGRVAVVEKRVAKFAKIRDDVNGIKVTAARMEANQKNHDDRFDRNEEMLTSLIKHFGLR